MQDLKIALIQTQQFWEDKQANFDYFEEQFLKPLVGQEIDLVLLPEMFNTGFTMNVEEMSESITGLSIAWLQTWAEKLNTTIGGSLIIRENGSVYNKFVLVNASGLLASYNKRHLFRMAKEHEKFTGGSEKIIVEIKGWKFCLQVCYDLRFPVFSRKKVESDGTHEYDALIYVANWPSKRAYIWQNLLQARAIENQCYVLGVNRVGHDANAIHYNGHSMLINPWGEVLNDMGEEECTLIQSISFEELTNIRKAFPAYLDADTYILS